MKLLTFPDGKDGQQDHSGGRFPKTWQTRRELWREKLLESLYDYSNELMELALAEEPIPEALIRKVRARSDGAFADSAGAVWFGAAWHGRAADSGCGGRLPAEPARHAAGRRHRSEDEAPQGQRRSRGDDDDEENPAKARSGEPFCGLVFKMLPYKTGDLAWVRIYSGTLEPNSRVLNRGQGQEGKRRAAVAHSRVEERRADRRRSGGRHRRRDRPARFDHGRHAVRHARADSAGVDRVSRDGHLDGDRAGEHRRPQEAGRHARRCSASRIRRSARRRTKKPARR